MAGQETKFERPVARISLLRLWIGSRGREESCSFLRGAQEGRGRMRGDKGEQLGQKATAIEMLGVEDKTDRWGQPVSVSKQWREKE